MYDFLTIGGATRDAFFDVSEVKTIDDPDKASAPRLAGFELGAKIIPDDAFFSYGGGAVNTAVSLSRMGFKVAGCARVGQEGTGDILLEDLKEHGVDWRHMERDPALHTGLSVIINIPDEDHVIFQYPGANVNIAVDRLEEIEARWIYLTSLMDGSTDLLNRIGERIAGGRSKLVFNPGEAQIKTGFKSIESLLGVTDVLIVNKEEAARLVGSSNGSKASAGVTDLLGDMQNWGSGQIVITDGKTGSFALTKNTLYHQPAYPVETIDATGAGDAFGSAYAAGLLIYDGDVARALKLATANAASVVGQMGAHRGALNVADAERMIARHSSIDTKIMEV